MRTGAVGCKSGMEAKATTSSTNQEPAPARFAAACKVLEDAIAAHAFPGCAFGVLAGGKVVLQESRGRFTYDDVSLPVSAETVYDLASVSKVVATTAIAMLLYQRGLLKLDMPLSALLPEFVAGRSPHDYAHRVTLRHLLAHNSGLPGYVEFFRTVNTSSALLSACLKLPLEAEPGTRAEYSDPGYILLGKALEQVIQEPLDAFAQREIFSPLGMTSTRFCPPTNMRDSIPPTEEDTWFRHRRVQGEVQDENAWILGGVAGHAGVFSNVPNLLRFARAILDSAGKTVPGGKEANLFASETVEVFARRQGPEGSSRAVGWDTPSVKSSSGRHFSRQSIGHLGYSGCSLWIDLNAGVAVALLTNRTWPDRQCQLVREIRPAFHDAVREAL